MMADFINIKDMAEKKESELESYYKPFSFVVKFWYGPDGFSSYLLFTCLYVDLKQKICSDHFLEHPNIQFINLCESFFSFYKSFNFPDRQ